MQNEFRALPKEILATWNAAWPDGSSSISVGQLKKSLQIYAEKKMDIELQVVPYHLGLWLLKNGWTKIKPMKSRRWKKEQSTTNAEAKSPAKANLRTTQVAQEVPARHRPWYIDFKYDSLRLSKLTFTKNVIFEKRAESEPEVYWELRHIAEALNADSEGFSMKQWFAHQRNRFEALRKEFEFDLITLRPYQRSVGKRAGRVSKTHFTQETLLTTIGLMAMLLQWTTSKRITLSRQAAAKAILTDLLRRVLSAVDNDDEVRTWCTHASAAETPVDGPLCKNQTSPRQMDICYGTSCKENVMNVTSMHETVTESLLYLFANREKHQHLHACLVHGLSILDSRIDDVIVKGKVGQVSPVFPSMWLESEVQRTVVFESSSTEKRKQERFTEQCEARKIRFTFAAANPRRRSEC